MTIKGKYHPIEYNLMPLLYNKQLVVHLLELIASGCRPTDTRALREKAESLGFADILALKQSRAKPGSTELSIVDLLHYLPLLRRHYNV